MCPIKILLQTALVKNQDKKPTGEYHQHNYFMFTWMFYAVFQIHLVCGPCKGSIKIKWNLLNVKLLGWALLTLRHHTHVIISLLQSLEKILRGLTFTYAPLECYMHFNLMGMFFNWKLIYLSLLHPNGGVGLYCDQLCPFACLSLSFICDIIVITFKSRYSNQLLNNTACVS